MPITSPLLSAHADSPHLPPEILLEIFSYVDRSTLAALCSTCLSFLELALPFLYDTAHFDHLPKPSTPRSRRLAELLPRLALSSVRTLHLTLLNRPTDVVLPRTDLPKLDHILIHHSQRRPRQYPPWKCLDDFLPHIDPLSVTFSLAPASDACAYNETALAASVWSSWTTTWTRLERLVVRGGSLSGLDRHERPSPHRSTSPTFSGGFGTRDGSVRFIYDLRTVDVGSLVWMIWSRRLLRDGVFDLPLAPLRPILIQTSSLEMEARVNDGLKELGVDGARLTYRDRVEIVRETEEEGEAVLDEMEGWRRRRCNPSLEGT